MTPRPPQTQPTRAGDATASTRAGDATASTRAAPAPRPGRRRSHSHSHELVLGRYRLERRLGAGAFGTVWRAHDERLDRAVAVKILEPERIAGGRFEREARAAARLSHPGIVTLYEASVDDDGAYLVSELVRGETLDRLLNEGRLSDRDIIEIGIALCEALHHAHLQGIVHRDVKPSNVLVSEAPASPAEVAKLTDFGVARIVDAEQLTLTGDVLGTLQYMSPEQAEGLDCGPAADLYSLAVVLYEALAGLNPLAASPALSARRRLGIHLPPLRRQRRDLPRRLAQAVDLALRPRPGERGSLTELRAALAATRELVGDEPGIVTEAWGLPTTASAEVDPLAGWREERARELDAGSDPDARDSPRRVWLERAVAGLAMAATTAWLARFVVNPEPIPPALAALVGVGLALVIPRIGWVLLALSAAAAALAQHHAGAAVIVLAAMGAPVILVPRRPASWSVAAGAPALALLGVAGLAGAWPALAALAPTPWRRAALGALGWFWLIAAAGLAGRRLYLPAIPGVLPRAAWVGSASQAVDGFIAPVLSAGALAPAVLWAAAAAVLPLVRRVRGTGKALGLTLAWAAALVLGPALLVSAAAGSDHIGIPPGAAVGAIMAVLVGIAPVALDALGAGRSLRGGSAPRLP